MGRNISSNADILDSRDIIRRRDDLQDELEGLQEAIAEARDELKALQGAVTEARDQSAAADGVAAVEFTDTALEDAEAALQDAEDGLKEAEAELKSWLEDYEEELRALQELCDEGEGYCPDWRYGVGLIRDSYFQQYAMDFADDIGAINRENHWPNNCINWEQAADDLKMDYTSLEFEGVTYWAR
jgi:cell division septum initiation protein DivIVA